MMLRGRQRAIAIRRLQASRGAFLAHMQVVRSIAFAPGYQYTWSQRIIIPANHRLPGAGKDGWTKPKPAFVVLHDQTGWTGDSLSAWKR